MFTNLAIVIGVIVKPTERYRGRGPHIEEIG